MQIDAQAKDTLTWWAGMLYGSPTVNHNSADVQLLWGWLGREERHWNIQIPNQSQPNPTQPKSSNTL